MPVFQKEIALATRGRCDVRDITAEVARIVAATVMPLPEAPADTLELKEQADLKTQCEAIEHISDARDRDRDGDSPH
jgi:hypothetical protein